MAIILFSSLNPNSWQCNFVAPLLRRSHLKVTKYKMKQNTKNEGKEKNNLDY